MIMLSPKHGVNPALGVCQWCEEEDGTLAFMGRLPNDAASPRRVIISMEPCKKCKEKMALGITIVYAEKRVTLESQPPKLLGWCVVKEEAGFIQSIQPDELRESVLRERMCFVDKELWERITKDAV